jgi:TrmH family RNA methyltransferase
MTAAFTSPQNPLLKEARRAASRGERTADGCVVAEGFHLLQEAIRSGVEIRAAIVAESARGGMERFLDDMGDARIAWVTDQVFRGIATTEHPQGVIALVRSREWTFADLLGGVPLIMVLDGVQDPGNAGTIVRTAEAFGASGAVFLKGSVSPHNPKCLRASAGSLFRLPVASAWEPAGLTLYAAMPRASLAVDRADFAGPSAIVIGSEGRGVTAELAAQATGVRIPTSRVESLNAAAAAAVMLYEAQRQRSKQDA